MTDLVEIQSERLKAIRKGRKIGRVKLAKLAGLTERKLTKIEASAISVLPLVTVAKLADALQVPEPTLTGSFPITQADLTPVETKCTSGCCS